MKPCTHLLYCLVLAGVCAGCAAPNSPQRFAWVTGLKPDWAAAAAGKIQADTKEVFYLP